MSDVLHILQGLNAPASHAVRPDERGFTTTDSLSCGPLEPFTDVAQWKTRRLAFWRSISSHEVADDLLGDTAELVSARKIVIWLGTSLDSQLALAFLAALLRAVGAAPQQLELIQFQGNQRDIEILDLGMLEAEDFSAHPPAVALSPDDLAELERAWNAIVSPDPEALVATLQSPHGRLPFFKRALRALLLRYPEKDSGVNATEVRLLHWIRREPRAARIIGEVLGETFAASRAGVGGLDLCGDAWLFRRMLRLGDPALREPVLEISGSREHYRNTTVRLTAFGERVLEGKANFVQVNGIDDWVAGVHLQSDAGRVWFHDDGRLVKRR